MIAGALEVQMFANLARLQKDMNETKKLVGGAMKSVESSVASAKGVLASLGAGISFALLLNKVDSVSDGMAKLKDVSEKTGASVEEVSKLQFFGSLGGQSVESMSTALSKLSTNMVSVSNEGAAATQALKFLGLAAKDENGNLKTADVLYGEIAKSLDQYTDGAGKNAIARALMGKTGADQIPVMKKMIELGEIEAIVTTEQAQAAEDYQVKLALLHRQKEALWNIIVGALLPSMTALTGAMLDASQKADSMGASAKKLAQDGSIEEWADKGALAIAAVIDLVKSVPGILGHTTSTIALLAADADVLAKRLTLTNLPFMAAQIAAGKNPVADLEKALADRNAIKEGRDREYIELLNRETNATQKSVQAQIDARKSLNKFMAGIGVDAMLDDAMFGGGAKKPLNFSIGDAKLAAAELKLYQGAVKRLVDELGDLNNQSEREKLNFEMFGKNVTMADGTVVHLTGNLENLTAAHKKILPFLAEEIDKRRGLILVSKLNGEAYDALYKSQQALLALQTSAFQADQDQIADMQFRLGLVGKTTQQQERLNAVRQIDLKLQQDLKAAADAAGDNMGQFDQAREALMQQAEAQKKAVLDGIAVRVQAERDWLTGANAAFDEYIDHATNAAEQSKTLFTNAFRSMEDALVDFARTGKLDFKKLADSIISDLIRIQIRAALVGPMMSAQNGMNSGGGLIGLAAKFFGSMGSTGGSFGTGGATGGFAKGGAFDQGGKVIPFARGGIVSAPTPFRFGSGGVMPGVMGERGPEAILPLRRINGELGVAASGAESGPNIVIEQHLTFGSDVNQSTLAVWAQQIRKQTKIDVQDAYRRGGGFKKAMGG